MVNNIIIALMPFLTRPFEKIHLAELSRELNAPHPTVRLWMQTLEREAVVKSEIFGRMKFYSLNFNHYSLPHYLVMAEKEKLILRCSKEPGLARLVQFLLDNSKGPVLIFGSAVESFKTAEDIDIFHLGKKTAQISRKIFDRFNKEADFLSVKDFDEVDFALKSEIIKKHLLVSGSEDFIKWFLKEGLIGANERQKELK